MKYLWINICKFNISSHVDFGSLNLPFSNFVEISRGNNTNLKALLKKTHNTNLSLTLNTEEDDRVNKTKSVGKTQTNKKTK